MLIKKKKVYKNIMLPAKQTLKDFFRGNNYTNQCLYNIFQ